MMSSVATADVLSIVGDSVRQVNTYNSSTYPCYNPVANGGAGSYVWDFQSNPDGSFAINSVTGAVSPSKALTVGNYPITVRVTDAASATATKAVVVSVVNTGIVTLKTDTILDNYGGSNWFCEMGIYADGFANTNTGTTWTLTDASGYFSIPTGYNLLSMPSGPPPAGNYPITLALTQNGSNLGPFNFTIHVLPAQLITNIDFTQNVVSTSQISGVVVGTASTIVWEPGYVWSIPADGSDGGTFTILDSSTGVVSLAKTPALGDRSLTIQVQDGLNTYSQTFTVHVVQGTTLPAANMSLAVPTNLDNYTNSGTLGTPTVSGMGTPIWSFTGDGVGYRYAIDSATGTITIIGPLSYNPTINGVDYSDVLAVTCTDGINTCTNSFRIPVAKCVGPTLEVGPGQTYPHLDDAIAYCKAQGWGRPLAGLTFNIHPSSDPNYYENDGQYYNVNGVWPVPLTIQGAPGEQFPLFWGNRLYYAKGFFMGYSYDVWIKNVEIAYVSTGRTGSQSDNLTAIAKETGRHTGNAFVDNVYIHDCQDGIARGAKGCKWFITNTRISHCGVGQIGYTHNIYVYGDFAYFHNVLSDQSCVGHLLKSRCDRTTIDSCRLYDGELGHGSLPIDLPEGGIDTITNTIVQKGPNWQNSNSIHFAEPGDSSGNCPHNACTVTNCQLFADVYDPSMVTGIINRSLAGADGTMATLDVVDATFFNFLPTRYVVTQASNKTGDMGITTVSGSTALLAQPALDWSFPGPGPDPTIAHPAGPFLAPYGVPDGAQITIPVDEIRLDVDSPIGTSVVQPTWLPGNTGATSPTWSLRKNPGSRYAIDPTTGAITTAQQLVPGMIDCLQIDVAQTGINFNQFLSGVSYNDHPSDGSFIHSIYVVVSGDQLPTYVITASGNTGGTVSPSGSTVVTQGYSQTYTITPDTNYSIADVTVDGTSVGPVSTYTFSNVTANHTIAATFIASYAITASPGTGGTISPSGQTLVVPGGSQTFTISANTGYVIANVLVDGVSVGAVNTYTFDNVSANHTISALFNSLNTVLKVYKEGSTVTLGGALDLTFGGVTDANVVQVTVDDTALTGNSNCYYYLYGTDAIESPTSYLYYLYKFDLSSIPADANIVKAQLRLYETYGNGTATLAPIVTHNWTEATACTAGPDHPTSPNRTWGPNSDSIFSTADFGTLASFESAPAGAAYSVKDVTSDVQAFVSGTQPNYGWAVSQGGHAFIFSEADAPTYDPGQRPALFVSYVVGCTINASAGTGGTISPTGAVTVASGDSQTFTITADTGYTIADVTVDGTSVGAVSTYTFSNVTTNHTIATTFNQVYTITASAATGGAITPTGTVQVTSGNSQTFTVTADTGYTIADVTVDGTSVGAVSTYTFDNVTADHTIAAAFNQVFTITASAATGGTITPAGAVQVASARLADLHHHSRGRLCDH